MTTVPADVRSDLLRAAHAVRTMDGRVRLDEIDIGALADGAALQGRLAGALYTRWFTGSTGRQAEPAPPDPALLARLRAAHASSGRFERGWVAALRAPGLIIATRALEELPLQRLDHVNLTRPAAPIRAGDELGVSMRREVVDGAGGWWLTYGKAGTALDERLVRIYWNGGPGIVAELIRRLTTSLEAAAERYTIKCPLASPLFERADPIVTYLDPGTWSRMKTALRVVHASLEDELRAAVPPLTLRLGRGVAVAEDPGDGQSFGQSRAAAVAEGLVSVLSNGHVDDDTVVEALRASLAAHGISPTRPYLGVSSASTTAEAWSW